jgi:hypothetical protein
MGITRRAFLSGCGAASAAAVVAPSLWIRRARAQTEAFGQVQHVLVLFAQGGMRSHCMFNAVGDYQHNPFGTQPAASEWTLGAVCGNSDIDTATFGTIPGLYAIASDVTVLPCIDHLPGAPPIVQHERAVALAATGEEDGRHGLLARVLQGHPRYVDGVGLSNLPPVDIGRTPFGASATGHIPLRLASPGAAVPTRTISENWATRARSALDDRFSKRVLSSYDNRLGILRTSKRNAFEFADLLVDPLLDVIGATDASADGFTNAQLLEVLGNHDLQDVGDEISIRSWGADVALALRMFGLGAPMVAVARDIYDTHDRESLLLPIRSADLARQLAGLNYLLKAMPHPTGGSYWNHTLVVVYSEFSRNNTRLETGFNSALGSDHLVTDPVAPMRNQAVALMGGVLTAAGTAGRQFGATDESMNPIDDVFTMRSLQSTLLDLLGVDHTPFWPDAPIAPMFS